MENDALGFLGGESEARLQPARGDLVLAQNHDGDVVDGVAAVGCVAGLGGAAQQVFFRFRRRLQDHLALAVGVRCRYDPGRLHRFNDARGTVVADLQVPLDGTDGCLAGVADMCDSLEVQLIFTAIAQQPLCDVASVQRHFVLVAVGTDVVQPLVVIARCHYQQAQLAGGVGQFVLVRLCAVYLRRDRHGLGFDLDRFHIDWNGDCAAGSNDADGHPGHFAHAFRYAIDHFLLLVFLQQVEGHTDTAQFGDHRVDQVALQQLVRDSAWVVTV